MVGADRIVEVDDDPAHALGAQEVERDLGQRVRVMIGPEPLHAIPDSVHS